MFKIYTTDEKFLGEVDNTPKKFTGVVKNEQGSVFWMLNGKSHRINGPSVEWSYGYKEWRIQGKLHRLDGPAVESDFGDKRWYLDDKEVTEEQHKLFVSIMKLKGLL